ncbi:MAG: hypothetical protein OQK78_00780 [Gammaproteobacteria bacterium]|nr:hypothetical protein [Gammaproteobacteria bacterium]
MEKLFSEFLGFVVLLSPLVLLLIWIPLTLWVSIFIGKKFVRESSRYRKPVIATVFVFMMILPLVDELVGRIYFNHLCDTQAGVKIYKTIELPAEYWDENGRPRFYKRGVTDFQDLYLSVYDTGAYSEVFHIDNAGFKYIEKQTNFTLGEVKNFRYWGGVRNNLSINNSATRCDVPLDLVDKIFVSK